MRKFSIKLLLSAVFTELNACFFASPLSNLAPKNRHSLCSPPSTMRSLHWKRKLNGLITKSTKSARSAMASLPLLLLPFSLSVWFLKPFIPQLHGSLSPFPFFAHFFFWNSAGRTVKLAVSKGQSPKEEGCWWCDLHGRLSPGSVRC